MAQRNFAQWSPIQRLVSHCCRKFCSVVTIDLVVEHGVEQDAEAELAARTIGLQRQLGLEVHVEGEASEHLSHSQGYPGLNNLLFEISTCSS